MVMTPREAAGVLAQTKWLKDQIKVWEEEAKKVLALELSAGERTAAIAPDGTNLGYVTMSKGKRAMKIDNEEGFLMWVKQRYPTEVVETVRPAFIKLCQEKVTKLGGLPDANGELCPHVSLEHGDPYSFVTLDEFADMRMQTMILERKLMDVVTPPSEINSPGEIVGHEDVPPPSFTCPKCRKVSYHPDDIANKYCGNCHTYFGESDGSVEPEPVEPEPFIEEGPPNWPESNTFETSEAVRQRRMR